MEMSQRIVYVSLVIENWLEIHQTERPQLLRLSSMENGVIYIIPLILITHSSNSNYRSVGISYISFTVLIILKKNDG